MSEILFEMQGHVLVVTFNRPDKGNAFTGFMAKILLDKLKVVAEDRSVRAILLRGNGAHFMDGHELSVYANESASLQDHIHQKIQFFYTSIREIQAMEKPVLAALQGRVTGAGFTFMLACDLVMAAQSAVINPDFTSRAMVPDGGTTALLPRKVGAGKAVEILMLNEDISALEARRLTLINRVVADEALQAEALAWAQKLAEGATRALGAAKRLVARSFEQDMNAQMSLESNFWNTGAKSFDFREAMKAHAANRPAKFTGA